jgi:hypothetical protein
MLVRGGSSVNPTGQTEIIGQIEIQLPTEVIVRKDEVP